MTSASTTYEHSLANAQLRNQYLQAGFSGRVGWGRRPAVLVIDMARAWLSTEYDIGADLDGVLRAVRDLLVTVRSREAGWPIFFTTMAHDPNLLTEVAKLKTPHSLTMRRGGSGSEIVSELDRRPSEPLLTKPTASAFVGTPLAPMLISQRIDTTIVVGCSTSGCIRATCESAFDLGFHVLVPAEAVGDRCPTAHAANLFDIDARYADVLPLTEVMDRARRAGQGLPPSQRSSQK